MLKAIQRDPDLSFQIRVRDEAVATLSSANAASKKGRAVSALLKLVRDGSNARRGRRLRVHSGNFKSFLYGKSL